MNDQVSIFLAIAIMALVTLFYRCGGYFIFARIRPNAFTRRALGYLPGCIFAAYVLPALLAGPAGNWFGALATLMVMFFTRNLGLSIAAGIASAWAARLAL